MFGSITGLRGGVGAGTSMVDEEQAEEGGGVGGMISTATRETCWTKSLSEEVITIASLPNKALWGGRSPASTMEMEQE